MANTATNTPITAAFARARAEGRVALIPYVMAGYPDLADGATVQHASQISLERGMTLAGALELAGRVSAQVSTPLVLMTYYNPIFSYGIAHFCEAAKAAGVAGLIVPDLPAEEADPLLRAARDCGIALVFLIAPTSTDARIEQVARVAAETGGFIYCVSLSGVTGARDRLSEHLAAFIARVRAHTSLPLAVGFGVARPEHVAAIGRIADGAVSASALLNAVDAAPPDQRIAAGVAFLRDLQTGAHLDPSDAP